MPDPRQKRLDLVLQELEQLPTLPVVAVRVLEVTADDTSSVADVVRLISSDASLTARILQLVHRADVGVRGEVSTVERAVVLLGFDAVRSAVLALSIFHVLGGNDPGGTGHFDREQFWRHSLSVACAAELLAGQLPGNEPKESRINPGEAFVCGLLHDLGKIALDTVLPKSFDRVVEAADLLRGNIADVERSVIGVDHMVVGKRLAERWQLPAVIRDCIWLHGQLPQALPASVRNPRMVNLITLADLLVRELHLGYSGNYAFPIDRRLLAEAIALPDGALERTGHQLLQQIELRARAMGLGQSSSPELYQQALEQANRELGRLSGQLADRNRKLSQRARFFDALSEFQHVLRPDASPAVVLDAIAQTAASVLNTSRVAVFNLPPQHAGCEVLLVDEQMHTAQTLLLDAAAPLSAVVAEEGPVQIAGQEMEWLLEELSPRLAYDQRYWIALEADGICIGGVLWGAPVGEPQRLSPQARELSAMSAGWSLALRTAQIREESRVLAEQLADSNRRLHEAQNELLRSRTMTTVGEMAAGAAHEMNNPLAVISGRSQLLAAQLEDEKQQSAARLIHEQSQRLSDMITGLMEFAKPAPPAPAVVDLASLVNEAIQQAKRRTDPADRTIEQMVTDVPPVWADPQQVRAAVLEVLDNALHATDGEQGRVEITAASDVWSSQVVLTVSDNGCGMDEQALGRAFDPFYSSRPAGRRGGMGLAKALRWIESNGGTIRIDSRPDQGTRVRLLLPAAEVAPAAQKTRRQAT